MSLTFTDSAFTTPQGTENVYPSCNRLLCKVGSALYYVTSAQVGIAEATGNIWIQKSTDNGVTWTSVYNGPKRTYLFSVQVVGTVIYIVGDNAITNVMRCYRFDTATDTFLADASASGITAGGNGFACDAYSTGKLLIVYSQTATNDLRCVTYDTALDTWSASALIAADSDGLGLVVDQSDDTAYCFYNTADAVILCAPISYPTTVGTPVIAFTGSFYELQASVGTPCISNGQVLCPIIDPAATTDPTVLYVIRSNVGTSLSFTADTIETGQAFPGAGPITLEGNILWFGWALVNFNDVPYLFWSDNVNQSDNSSSQLLIKYSSMTSPGTWTAAETAYSAPVPTSAMSLYPAALSSTEIGVVAAFANPVEFFGIGTKYDSLSNVFLLGSDAAPPNPPVIENTTPPDGTVGQPYAYCFGVEEGTGTPPYSWVASDLPPGLTQDPDTCLLSGTPTTPGSYTITVTVTDDNGLTDTIHPTIVILPTVLGNIRVTMRGIRRFAKPPCDEERRPEPIAPPVRTTLRRGF